MANDKARDDKFFDCDSYDEIYYVSHRYVEHEIVARFLRSNCALGTIKYSTHKQVYELIKEKLGYPIPVHQ